MTWDSACQSTANSHVWSEAKQTNIKFFFLLGVFPNISTDDLGVVSANGPLNKGGILGPDDLGCGGFFQDYSR